MNPLSVVDELPFSLLGVPLMADPDGDSDGKGHRIAGLQVGRPDEEPTVVLIEMPVIEGYAGLEAHNLFGVAKGKGEGIC